MSVRKAFSFTCLALCVGKAISLPQPEPSNAKSISPKAPLEDVVMPPQPTAASGKDYTFPGWLIAGDSFASGPGAGDTDPSDSIIGGPGSRTCIRRLGAFGPQLNREALFQNLPPNGFGQPAEVFHACSGGTTSWVADYQINEAEYEGLIALSAGGNDVQYTNVLLNCIIYPSSISSDTDCQNAIQTSLNLLYSEDFFNNYMRMVDLIWNYSKWSLRPESGSSPQISKSTLVYQIGYPQYFEDYTTQCNDVVFGISAGGGKTVPESLRQQISSGQQQLNALEAYWIDHVNVQYGAYPIDFMTQVNADWQYTDHRFCDPSVDEPDYGPTSWFFHFGTAGDRAAGISYQANDSTSASTFSAWDPKTCSLNPAQDEDWTDAIGCASAKLIANGASPDQLFAFGSGDFPSNTFHPRINGHTAIASELQYYMEYREGQSPVDQTLRIMAIGDSITFGYQSSEGSGYRKPLYEILNQRNTVNFVGSQSSGSGTPWQQSEGYSGYTTAQILSTLLSTNNLQKYSPNVAIIMAGTNDINLSNGDASAVTTALNNLRRIIGFAQVSLPHLTIIVAHIPPNGKGTFGSQLTTLQKLVIQYNAGISQLVNQMNSELPRLPKILVQHTTCSDDPVDKADSLHPNDQGYSKLASDFALAISRVVNAGLLSAPPTPSSPTGPTNVQCSGLPNWIPNGEIANGAGLGANRYPDLVCTTQVQGCFCVNPGYPVDDPRNAYYTKPPGSASCADMSYYLINAVHFGDLDGDGYKDYLWVGPDGQVQMFQNGGPKDPNSNNRAQVIWYPRGEVASGVGGQRQEIQFGDLNGDGRDDYLWVHPNGSVSAWINAGFHLDSSGQGSVTWLPQGLIASGIGYPGSAITFADLNGDKRVEYLAIADNGAVECYLNGPSQIDDGPNAGHRIWISQGTIATGVGGIRNQTFFADMNGDLRADYLELTLTGSGAVSEWLNGGGPDDGPNAAKVVWYPQGKLTGGDGSSGANVMFADLDGDSRAEYLEVDPNTSAVTAYWNGCPGVAG